MPVWLVLLVAAGVWVFVAIPLALLLAAIIGASRGPR